MGRVQKKVAIITGGARGIGEACARILISEGAKVVIGDLLDEQGAALAVELGSNAAYVHLDVTEPEQWQAAVAFAVKTFGGLNILVNNAGIASAAPITEFKLEIWRKTLDINLTGTFLGMQAAKLMLFLASDESSYSTSAEFVIDGGLTMGVPHH